jgi:hypothetical protein
VVVIQDGSSKRHVPDWTHIYKQFTRVVILRDQMRIQDPEWNEILDRLRTGDCTKKDLLEIRKLVLTDPECEIPDFTTQAWKDVILVMPRDSVREEWNKAALIRNCDSNHAVLHVSHAEDKVGPDRERLSLAARVTAAGKLRTLRV